MRIVVLDFETFYADDYTLSKSSTEAYIRDPRFEAHGAAIKWQHNIDAKWYDERELRYILKNEDWSDTLMIHHHAQFDGLILSHHYDVHPKMIGCTLSMARLLLGNHLSVSLDSVRKHFGFPLKTTPYNLFKGKHWSELTPEVREVLADGCCDEVESIWKIFGLLLKDFPREELEVVSTTMKMFCEPVLRADLPLLRKLWETEEKNKTRLMQQIGATEADLQSANRFAELLREHGEEPETKEGKNGPIFAFAKSDSYMRDYLLEHDNEKIRWLAQARLGVKSTLLQTRAETLAGMARRGPDGSDSPLPVYLRYAGAGTLRVSGGDGCLTADTQVLVFDYQKGLTKKRIVDIMPDDLIWDGEDFVQHGGIKFRGYKRVIEHDGVRGTEDHIIFDASGKEISLAEAARLGKNIMDCPTPDSKRLARAGKRNTN